MLALASPTSPPVSLRGARHPRVSTAPAYVDSYGPEAGALMLRAGRPLDPWQQDSIDLMLSVRPDGKWACFEFCEWCSRQNGKGAILEARALAGLFLLGEELIMWSAHEYKTSMEAFRRLLGLLRNLGRKINDNLYEVDGILLKINNTHGEEGIERLDTGQRIRFVARSKSSGRGFTGDVVIIDETFAYTMLQQDALMPTLSARPNPQIIYTSSPPLDSESGEVMFHLRLRGDPTAARPEDAPPWGQDDSLGYRDWGLAGDLDNLREVTLDDLALWVGANPAAGEKPALGVRITFETIGREYRSMGAVGFARERLGIWPRSPLGGGGWLIIPQAEWRAAADPDSHRRGVVALSIEVELDRAEAVIVVAGRRADRLRHVEIADQRPGTGWVVERAAEMVKRLRPCAVVVDSGGPAGSLIADLEAAGVEVVKPSVREYAAACGLLVDGIAGKVEDGRNPAEVRNVRHLGQPALTTSVAGLRIRKVAETSVFERAGQGFIASGAALAIWGHAAKGPGDYNPVANVH